MTKKVTLGTFTLSIAVIMAAVAVFFVGSDLAKGSPAEVGPAAWAGQSLSSAFAVQNRGDVTATVVVDYYDSAGTSVSQQSSSIGPKSIGNFVAPMTGPWIGSAVVSSDQQIVAIANDADAWGAPTTYGTYNGFTSSDLTTTMYLPFVVRERPTGRNSLIGIQNAGSSSANVTISYYAVGSGSAVKSVTVDIPVGAAMSRNLFYSDTELSTNFMGYVKVVSNNGQPVAAAVSDVATNAQYSYSGIASPANVLYMPFIQKNRGGTYPLGQSTAWAILNSAGVTATINVTYTGTYKVGSVDTPIVVYKTQDLGPYQLWNYGHPFASELPDTFLGSAIAGSTQPLVGIVNQTDGAAFADPGNKTSYRALSTGTTSLALPALWRNWGGRTGGVIIQNLDPVTTTLTANFTPRVGSGNPLTVLQTVGPGGFWNFGMEYGPSQATDLSGLGTGFYGAAEITSSAGRIVGIVNIWSLSSTGGDTKGTYNGFSY